MIWLLIILILLVCFVFSIGTFVSDHPAKFTAVSLGYMGGAGFVIAVVGGLLFFLYVLAYTD